MTTKQLFKYKFGNGLIKEYPFRPGDIVSVKDWGGHYCSYTKAFKTFGFGEQINHGFNSSAMMYYGEKPKLYKLVAVLQHETMNDIICHIRSRTGHNFVMGIDGLKEERVYPLRIGEKKTIEVKKLGRN